MAYAALISLERTTNLVLNPHKYPISVAEKEKITSLHEYVMLLISFLEDFPEKVRRLEAKIRDLADQTEAIIEDFMWKQNRISWWSSIGLSRSELLEQLRKETEEIGPIVGEVIDERGVGNSASTVSSSGFTTTNQKDLLTIKDRLCGGSSKLRVIPIVGMGGIDKTTLARKAYDDPLIVDCFHIRAWVTVSQDYSVRKILLSLIDSMKLFINEQVLEHKIYEHVYKTLKSRKFLIVMDDIWSTEVWDDLTGIYLEEVDKEIAQKCVGLPLAVVLVAGVLFEVNKSYKTQASWEKIARNVNPMVGLELEAILSLSYTHLPHHLWPCLLYIGGFPEDRIIHASTLIRLWVAEGFLKYRDRCSLEEEAEGYLEDLVKRNLVIVNSRKTDGKIKSCSVHDMVRNLCITEAHEEKFLRLTNGHVSPQGLMNERMINFSERRGRGVLGRSCEKKSFNCE